VAREKLLADRGSPRVEQHAFDDFLRRGELDRHLRRMRVRYRERRDAIVDALAAALPDATVHGIAAGLHVTVELPPGVDEEAIRVAARERRILVETMGDYRLGDGGGPPTLMLGYGQMPEPTIRAGVAALAEAVREQALDVGAAGTSATA
jgi:GntR family transcriptional regulator/MocR family aminotransferase